MYNSSIYPQDHAAATVIDCPVRLRSGTGDAEYLSLLRQHLTASLEKFRPQFVIYNAGTDWRKPATACPLATERVLLATGASIAAGSIRVGMQLLGELDEPVNVTAACATEAALPRTRDFFRVTLEDAATTSFVVTSGHLMTLMVGPNPTLHRRPPEKRMILPRINFNVLDPETLAFTNWGGRTCRATEENDDASYDFESNPSKEDAYAAALAFAKEHLLETKTAEEMVKEDSEIRFARWYVALPASVGRGWKMHCFPFAHAGSRLPTLVRRTYGEVRAAMRVAWEQAAENDPESLPARAWAHGDIVEVTVDSLVESGLFLQTHGRDQGCYFRALRAVPTAPAVPSAGFVVRPSFFSALSAVHAKCRELKKSAAFLGDPRFVGKHWYLKRYFRLVEQDAAGVFTYRPLRIGDRVKVVLLLHNGLKGAAQQWENANGSKAATMVNLERILTSLRIPLDGLVFGELQPIVGVTNAIDSTLPEFDDIIASNMKLVLRELGATAIIAFGTYNKYRWQHFAAELDCVNTVRVVEDEEHVELTVSIERPALFGEDAYDSDTARHGQRLPRDALFVCGQCGQLRPYDEHKCPGSDVPASASSASMDISPVASPDPHALTVQVYLAPHPCRRQHRASIEHAFRECYGIPFRRVKIASIEPVAFVEPQAYAPLTVDGGGRYQLASKVITHNCSVGDPLGQLSVSAEGIVQRDQMVFELCANALPGGGVPLLMLLSGGYQKTNAQVIATSIANLRERLHLWTLGGEEASGSASSAPKPVREEKKSKI